MSPTKTNLFWLSQLNWPVMLERMMEEVPQEFLEPKYLEVPPASDQKPAGQLNEAEKRLWGVVRWLDSRVGLEAGAHEALHDASGNNLSSQACKNYSIKEYLDTAKMNQAFSALVLSLKERLKLPKSLFFFNGEDAHSFEDSVITRIKSDFKTKLQENEENQDKTLEDWALEQFPPTSDPDKMN